MIAVAMLSGVAYGIITLIRSSLNSQKSLQAQDDARSLTDAFAMVLADSKACTNTFGTGAAVDGGTGGPGIKANVLTGATVITDIWDGKATPGKQFSVGNNYGGKAVVLSKILIGGSGTDQKSNRQKWIPGVTSGGTTTGSALVRVEWTQTKESVGPKDLIRYFTVTANINASGQIINCTGTPGGSLGTGAAPDPTSAADDGYVAVNNPGGAMIYSPQVTLNKGVYMVSFYNCTTGASPDYFVQTSAVFDSGSGTVGITNYLGSQLKYYQLVPFILKVASSTAVVRFYIGHMAGGIVLGDSSPCSGFSYTKISI